MPYFFSADGLVIQRQNLRGLLTVNTIIVQNMSSKAKVFETQNHLTVSLKIYEDLRQQFVKHGFTYFDLRPPELPWIGGIRIL